MATWMREAAHETYVVCRCGERSDLTRHAADVCPANAEVAKLRAENERLRVELEGARSMAETAIDISKLAVRERDDARAALAGYDPPMHYSADGSNRITLGEVVAAIADAIDAGDKSHFCRVMDDKFLFGVWSSRLRPTEDPRTFELHQLCRDLRGMFLDMYREGRKRGAGEAKVPPPNPETRIVRSGGIEVRCESQDPEDAP